MSNTDNMHSIDSPFLGNTYVLEKLYLQLDMTSYYDLVLALIPLTLLGGTLGLLAVGVSLIVAVPVGASIAVLLIGHAMFVRSPVHHASTSSAPESTAGPSVSDVAAD